MRTSDLANGTSSRRRASHGRVCLPQASSVVIRPGRMRKPIEAYGDGLKVALCSPQFLYLKEGTKLSSFTLASRLSYFRWSTMAPIYVRICDERGIFEASPMALRTAGPVHR